MKRILLIALLMVSVLAVNAQVDTTHNIMKPAKTMVKVADLPKAITETIAKDYPGFTVKEASTTVEGTALNYQVQVSKGMDNETLVFDKDGKFLKKLPKKE